MAEDKTKTYYFTKEHEEAIIQYTKTEDPKIRTDLYVNWIGPVFNEMVDKIVYTYKFNDLPNIEQHKEDCKVWLTTILGKYDPDVGSKAFSYFSVVVRNWFYARSKKRSKQLFRESSYENISQSLEEEFLSVENGYDTNREKEEFVNHLKGEIDTWDEGRRGRSLGKNDKKVISAIQILMEHSEELEIFNKKAIYLNLREITGLNTKQITRSLKKFKPRYRNFKDKWDNGDI